MPARFGGLWSGARGTHASIAAINVIVDEHRVEEALPSVHHAMTHCRDLVLLHRVDHLRQRLLVGRDSFDRVFSDHPFRVGVDHLIFDRRRAGVDDQDLHPGLISHRHVNKIGITRQKNATRSPSLGSSFDSTSRDDPDGAGEQEYGQRECRTVHELGDALAEESGFGCGIVGRSNPKHDRGREAGRHEKKDEQRGSDNQAEIERAAWRDARSCLRKTTCEAPQPPAKPPQRARHSMS